MSGALLGSDDDKDVMVRADHKGKGKSVARSEMNFETNDYVHDKKLLR